VALVVAGLVGGVALTGVAAAGTDDSSASTRPTQQGAPGSGGGADRHGRMPASGRGEQGSTGALPQLPPGTGADGSTGAMQQAPGQSGSGLQAPGQSGSAPQGLPGTHTTSGASGS
jgi:hypothetical protein